MIQRRRRHLWTENGIRLSSARLCLKTRTTQDLRLCRFAPSTVHSALWTGLHLSLQSFHAANNIVSFCLFPLSTAMEIKSPGLDGIYENFNRFAANSPGCPQSSVLPHMSAASRAALPRKQLEVLSSVRIFKLRKYVGQLLDVVMWLTYILISTRKMEALMDWKIVLNAWAIGPSRENA